MYYDRVQETTNTTGTGAFSLSGAVSGFRTFNSVVGLNVPVAYCIFGGSEWEVGIGSLSGLSTLSRDLILSSSNSDNIVSFSAGTKNIFCTFPGFVAQQIPSNNVKGTPAANLHFGV